LDGSAESAHALPVAQGFAKATEATVHILHVCGEGVSFQDIRRKLRLENSDMAGAVLNQRTGPAAPAITQEAERWRSDIIVMCSHSGTETHSGGLGEHAREILLHTPCPVLFVPPARGPRPWSMRRILVPHDGTPTSALALSPIGDLCRRAQAEMTVLHVSTAAADPADDRGSLTAPRYIDQPHHEWPAWGTEFLERVRAMAKPPCELRLRTVLGTEGIGQAIVRFATEEESDLIVLAWRGKLDQDRARTVRLVVERAPCPTVIYRVVTS
jgi:nucleotide-binding universal stress UspA family protein